jgi:adenylate cyclase
MRSIVFKRWRLKLVIPFLFLSLNAYATQETDSLWNVWLNAEQEDSIRLDALHSMAREGFLQTNPDSAFHLGELKYEYALEKGLELQRARALMVMGVAKYNQGAYTEAVEFYYRSLEISEKIGNEHEATRALNNIGNIYVVQAQFDRAIQYLTRTLRMHERLGNQLGMASTLNNIGVIYLDQGDNEQALDAFSQCLAILETLEHTSGMASMLTNLAIVYENMGDLESALENQFESLRLEEKVGDRRAMALTLGNIGHLYRSKAMYDSATVYFEMGLSMAEEIGDQVETSAALTNLARVNADLNQHQRSIEFAERSLALARESGAIREMRNAAESLFKGYKYAGRSAEALEMHELYISMRDSILNQENQREVLQQHFNYEMEKREALAEAEQEKIQAVNREQIRRKNLQLNAFIGGLVLMSLLAGVFLVQRRRIGKEKERSDGLLLNILPKETADELKAHGSAESRYFEEVTVLFTDFVGFTKFSEKLSPGEVVDVIHDCFSIFDDIVTTYGVEKIKTIGDAYMAVGGLPTPNDTHARDVVLAAMEMQKAMIRYFADRKDQGLPAMDVRVGVNSGPVVAGIVGKKKFQYDIWGDTVNTAARMESSGEAGKVNVSESTYEIIKDDFECLYRGKIHAKNKGEIGMYFVSLKESVPELS